MSLNYEELPIGEEAPFLVDAVVEVLVGSRNKYEYDPEMGIMVRDRVLPGAVRYPADYGFIPSTVAEDGDPLDVVVAAYDPAFPGCLVQVRPIGALNMSDSNGRDRTILAVPEDDPRFSDIESLEDLPDQNLTEIEEFFEVYKRLEGDKEVEIHGWLSLTEAHDVIRESAR